MVVVLFLYYFQQCGSAALWPDSVALRQCYGPGAAVSHLVGIAYLVECMNYHEHHVYHDDTLHPTDAKI